MLGAANKGETKTDRNIAGKRSFLVISVLHKQDEKNERARGHGPRKAGRLIRPVLAAVKEFSAISH
jgi:hypothetical protein